MKNVIVYYHKDCSDGFTAAWAAYKKFGNRAEYIPLRPREHIHDIPINSTCYAVDWTPDPDDAEKILYNGSSLTILDHHISSEHDFDHIDEEAFEFIFDNNHSGAALAWKYFHPKRPLPKLVKHVEDVDIWKFKYKDSAALSALISNSDQTFQNWNRLARTLEDKQKSKQLIRDATLLMKHEQKLMSRIASKANWVKFERVKGLEVNCPIFQSEIGNMLAERSGTFGIVWYDRGESLKVSLRGVDQMPLDKIAKKYGGGGHRNAAAFYHAKDKKLPWKEIDV